MQSKRIYTAKLGRPLAEGQESALETLHLSDDLSLVVTDKQLPVRLSMRSTVKVPLVFAVVGDEQIIKAAIIGSLPMIGRFIKREAPTVGEARRSEIFQRLKRHTNHRMFPQYQQERKVA